MRSTRGAAISKKSNPAKLFAMLFTGALLFVQCQKANACLNDRETYRAEEEFRSRYQAPPQSVAVSHTQVTPLGWIAMGLGVGLTAGSVVVAISRERRGSIEKSSH